MPEHSFKVHAYRIQPGENTAPLNDVLSQIHADDIDSRDRLASQAPVRVDDIRQFDDIWLMDFILKRYEGPALVQPGAHSEGFAMGPDDRFGEETAVLYHPASNYMLVQYNHRGVKPGRAVAYFNVYDGNASNAYDVEFILDPEARAKLVRYSAIPRKLQAKIDAGAITESERDNNISARYALESRERFQADTVDLTISATEKKASRLGGRFQQFLDSIQQMASRNSDAVQSLKFEGKETPDTKAQTLDLLGQRLQETVDDVPIGEGRRLTQDGRYNALCRVWDQWRRLLSL